MRRLAVLGVLASLASASAAFAAPRLIPYVVQPGETCFSIAETQFGNPELHTLIHEHNDLGPMPHILAAGQQLMLPADRVRPEARIEDLLNDVKARAPRTVSWQRARDRMTLWQLYRVATGDESSAGIAFRDESRLRMREEALLIIHGGAADKAKVTAAPKTDVLLEKGTIVGGLSRLDAQVDLTVRTAAGQVDLRATEAQVEVTEGDGAAVSIWTGQAKVTAEGTTVAVPEAHGTTMQKGSPPKAPRKLPPQVPWSAGMADRIVVVPPGVPGTFRAAWDAVERADRYRVELVRDEPGNRMVADVVVGSGLHEFEAQALAPGRYLARVSAIDADRLQGRPSRPLAVQVSELRPSRPVEPGPDGTVQATGMVALELAGDVAAALDVRVDGGATRPGTAPVRLYKPGTYRIEYLRRDTGGTSTMTLRLLAVRGKLDAPAGGVIPGADGPEVAVVLEDENGRPAALPGVALVARPGGVLPTTLAAPGRYVASLAPLEGMDPGTVDLAAEWALGTLDRRSLAVETEPAPPGERPFAWTWAPASPFFAGSGLALPAAAPRPVTRVGAGAAVTGPSGGGRVRMAGTLEGEVALLDGRLGLDLAFPWIDAVVGSGPLNRSNLGDLRLGARYVAASGAKWAIVPMLRVTAPTSDGSDRTVLEPGILAEWWPVGPLVLYTSQAFPVDVARDDAAVRWVSHWGPGVRLARWVDLLTDVEVHVGLRRAGRVPGHAVAVGGGFRFLLGRARLGVHAAGGVDDGGRDLLGRFTAGLSLEVGFKGP